MSDDYVSHGRRVESWEQGLASFSEEARADITKEGRGREGKNIHDVDGYDGMRVSGPVYPRLL